MRALSATTLVLLACAAHGAHAQRSSEDAVAEAEDAFGMTVGREAIGLYSATNARGFSPVQAGNIRIDGLYFDQVTPMANLPTRLLRSATVHVGIAAQGYLSPAPTGVVNYLLRVPGNETVVSELIGDASYGVAYSETDAQIAVIPDTLSMGGGVGYTRNAGYSYSPSSYETSAGWLARWQPNAALVVTPFWGMINHREFGERPSVLIDSSGYPAFRADRLPAPPWARWAFLWQTFGLTARYAFGDSWQLSAGVFRSLSYSPGNDNPLLLDTDGMNQGIYEFEKALPNSSGSTSGEVRLSKRFDTRAIHHTLYARITGRDSSIESGGAQTGPLGAATTTYLPPLPRPDLALGLKTDVLARQLTPGFAYAASWPEVAQLTLGLQKVFYHRTIQAPDTPSESDHSTPWLYNAAVAVSLTHRLLFYTSYTRGFEEIGIAPLNAANRFEPVPAQQDRQVDAGFRYQLLPKLQLVTGVFEIDKPYANLDPQNVFRLVGDTRNRGVEFSLTGDITARLNIVSGIVLIRPTVDYQGGVYPGATNVIAIGPIPGYMSTYLQYHPAAMPGLVLGATIQNTSSRYAVYPNVNLPAVTTFGADVRYHTQLWGKNATFWLESYNLGSAYALTPSATGQLTALDARRFELSLVIDL